MIEWTTPDNIDDLVEALENNTATHLEYFDTLTDYDVESLIPALEENTSVRALRFIQNGLQPKNITAICAIVKNITRLEEFTIRKNAIPDAAVVEIAQLVANHEGSLNSLTLTQGKIGDVGVTALASALVANDTLAALFLDKNEIKDGGAQELSNALRSPTCGLLELSLEYNLITANGGKRLAVALAENRSLEDFSLRGNKMNGLGIDALKRALEANTRIQRFQYDKQELSLEEQALHPETQEMTLEDELGEFAHLFAQANQNQKPRVQQIFERNRNKLFKEILVAPETWPWMKTNMVVVGALKSGKSSTVRALQGTHVSDSYVPTFGVQTSKVIITQYDNWKLDTSSSNVEPFAYQRYVDTAGRGRKGLEYEQPKAGSLREYEAMATPLPEDAAKLLSGQFSYAQSKAELATMTKHNIKMNVWDLSGNPRFGLFHEIFLGRLGVGLVVFDMCRFKEKKDDEALAEIKSQLEALQFHSPSMKIFLVGSNLDRVPVVEAMSSFEEDDEYLGEEEMTIKINGLLKDKLKVPENKQIVQTEDEYGDALCFWPTSSTEGKGINRLLDGLRATVNSLDSLLTRVSIRWLRILDLWVKEGPNIISRKKALEVAKTCGADTAEVERMIHVFHQLGSIVNLSSMDTIITKPQWLSDRIGRVSRDLKNDPFSSAQKSKYKFKEADAALMNTGLWTKDAIQKLWSDDSNKEFLTSFATDQLIIGKVGKSPETYISVASTAALEAKNLKSTLSSASEITIAFKRYSPSVYHRLVAACLNKGKGKKEPELASDGIKLFLGNTAVVLINNAAENRVEVAVEGDSTNTVETELKRMMKHVQDCILGASLEYSIKAN